VGEDFVRKRSQLLTVSQIINVKQVLGLEKIQLELGKVLTG